MQKQVLKVNDLTNWLNTQEYVYATDSTRKTAMRINLKGIISVWVKDKCVLTTISPTAAINAYNDL